MGNSITFLGVRGSMHVNGPEYVCYGTNTTSYLIQLGDKSLFVDCGSGFENAEKYVREMDEIHLLITHTHLDHMSTVFEISSMIKDKTLHVYGVTHEGLTIEEQFDKLMGPPNWPVTLKQCSNVVYHDVTEIPVFTANDLQVSHEEANHPGGSTMYRITGNGSSIVIATDFCHEDGAEERLVSFADHADLLIYDGMFFEEEYDQFPGWGHSTPQAGARIGEKANVKKIAIAHHGSRKTDLEIEAYEISMRALHPSLFFASEGLTVQCDGSIPDLCTSGHSGLTDDRLQMLADICMQLTSEQDRDHLYEHIIRSAMQLTNSDAGTLYIRNDETLKFKVMITKSQGFFRGGKGDEIDLPPVKLTMSNVCAASALTKQTINIPDAYDSDDYDFSGPRNYDRMTGYHTQSVLVVPMNDLSGNVVGVLQLINSQDPYGNVIPYYKEDELLVNAIASQAGICLTNTKYSEQLTHLLEGFVSSIVSALDERTPYNANHTRNMVAYGKNFLSYENRVGGKYQVDERMRKEIELAIWLHDIGKITTPLSIMNKSTRLGSLETDVRNRYDRMELLVHLAKAEGRLSQEQFDHQIAKFREERDFLSRCNQPGFLNEEDLAEIRRIGQQQYPELDGSLHPKLTEDEIHELLVAKGTLTAEERTIMENHVAMTEKMLTKLIFPDIYSHVTEWASMHHETLDVKGYPHALKAEDLSWQARFLTVLDIFEALTSTDRPYRKEIDMDHAFGILDAMVREGKIDGDILAEFRKSEAWVNRQ